MPPIRILFLAANPESTTRLNVEKEFNEIRDEINRSSRRDRFDLRFESQVQRKDLLPLLLREKPDIVHFGGHGTPEDEIILVDEDNAPRPVTVDSLRTMFSPLKGNVDLVVLNACYSEAQCEAIVESIPCAIGMTTSVTDRAAIEFARILYLAFAEGCSVGEAFSNAVNQLSVVQIPEEHKPRLLEHSGVSSAEVYPGGEPKEPDLPTWWEHEGVFIPKGIKHSFTVELKDRLGHALTSDSEHFESGDEVIRIASVSGTRWSGKCLHPDTGEWVGVVGSLTQKETAYLREQITVHWAGGIDTKMTAV